MVVPCVAQHRFHVKMLEDGKTLHQQGDDEQAALYLEIAAFGLLEYPDRLFEALAFLALSRDRLGDDEGVRDALFRIQSSCHGPFAKPPSMKIEAWARLQDLGEFLRPPPAIPSDRPSTPKDSRNARQEPASREAWLGILRQDADRDDAASFQRHLAQVLSVFPTDAEILSQALLSAQTLGLQDPARSLAEALITHHGHVSLAHEALANQAANAGRWGEASQHYRFVTRPEWAETRQWQSRTEEHLRADSTPAEASHPVLAASTDTIREAPPPTPAMEELAQAAMEVSRYLESGKLKKAQRVLQKLGQEHSSDPIYLDLYAHYNVLAGKHAQNVRVLSHYPARSETTQYYLAVSMIQLGDFRGAERLIEQMPESRREWIARARNQLNEARDNWTPEDAERARRAIRKDLEVALAEGSLRDEDRITLACLLADSGDWAAATPLIEALKVSVPLNHRIQYLSARLMQHRGEFKQAAQVFAHLINEGFVEGEVPYFCGLAYYRSGQMDIAKYMFSRALRMGTSYTEDIDTLLRRIRIESQGHLSVISQSKAVSAVIQDLEKALEQTRDQEQHLALLRLYAQTHEMEKFWNLDQQLDRGSLSREQSDIVLAWHLIKRGQHENARKLVEEYQSAEARFVKGYLEFLFGDRSKGEELLHALAPNKDLFPEIPLLLNQKS